MKSSDVKASKCHLKLRDFNYNVHNPMRTHTS